MQGKSRMDRVPDLKGQARKKNRQVSIWSAINILEENKGKRVLGWGGPHSSGDVCVET